MTKIANEAAAAPKPAKAAIAYRMLTSAKGTTRPAIVEACGGWGIDIKQFAERKGLKLAKSKDGIYSATAAKA